MSQYVSFFVRVKDNFAPIGCYSRNSSIGGAFFDRAPYGHAEWTSSSDIKDIRSSIEEDVKELQVNCDSIKEEIELIATFNSNSVEEKLEAISQCKQSLNEINKDIEGKKCAMQYCEFLLDMLDNIKYEKGFDESQYLYVGVECGLPTIETSANSET